MSTITTTTKWWWSKKTNNKKITASTKEKSVASSINGADEGASMFSLYSYDQSIYCPSTIHISSSIRAQHTKSEYSGNFSDVESTASILSKPWVSRNIIENKSIHSSIQDEQKVAGEIAEDDDDDDNSVLSDDERYSYSIPIQNASTENLDNSAVGSISSSFMHPKRRGSLVEYIVKKPLHGKLKAGFGRLVGRSHSNIEESATTAAVRRSSYS